MYCRQCFSRLEVWCFYKITLLFSKKPLLCRPPCPLSPNKLTVNICTYCHQRIKSYWNHLCAWVQMMHTCADKEELRTNEKASLTSERVKVFTLGTEVWHINLTPQGLNTFFCAFDCIQWPSSVNGVCSVAVELIYDSVIVVFALCSGYIETGNVGELFAELRCSRADVEAS